MSGASGPSPAATAPIAVETVPPERSSDATLLERLRYRDRDLAAAPLVQREHGDRDADRGDDRRAERDLRAAEPEADDGRDGDRPRPRRERPLAEHVERGRVERRARSGRASHGGTRRAARRDRGRSRSATA